MIDAFWRFKEYVAYAVAILLGLLGLCIALSRRWVPRSLGDELGAVPQIDYLRALFGYSAAYYSLWLGADILIVVGGLDLGWGVRIVPNQLYYAFWVPFAYWRFFSAASPSANGSRAPAANASRAPAANASR